MKSYKLGLGFSIYYSELLDSLVMVEEHPEGTLVWFSEDESMGILERPAYNDPVESFLVCGRYKFIGVL